MKRKEHPRLAWIVEHLVALYAALILTPLTILALASAVLHLL